MFKFSPMGSAATPPIQWALSAINKAKPLKLIANSLRCLKKVGFSKLNLRILCGILSIGDLQHRIFSKVTNEDG
jgi:hypothetical protein